MWAYNTAKGGVVNFVRSAAIDLGPEGIRVNAVCPGPIAGTGHDDADRARHAPDRYEELRRARPARAVSGVPEEVAAAIAFLLSADASYVNGVHAPGRRRGERGQRTVPAAPPGISRRPVRERRARGD